jgi:dolichol kinase
MDRFFTKTFMRFFVGFVLIIGAAFGVLALANNFEGPSPVDNLAAPK